MRAFSSRSLKRRPRAKQRDRLALAAPRSGLPPSLRSVRPWLPVSPVLSAFAGEEQNQPDRAAKGKNNVTTKQQQFQCEP
jgi:hypothetical protein